MKRALRNFGNLLGNCLYDKSYAQEVVKIKVTPVSYMAYIQVFSHHLLCSALILTSSPNLTLVSYTDVQSATPAETLLALSNQLLVLLARRLSLLGVCLVRAATWQRINPLLKLCHHRLRELLLVWRQPRTRASHHMRLYSRENRPWHIFNPLACTLMR